MHLALVFMLWIGSLHADFIEVKFVDSLSSTFVKTDSGLSLQQGQSKLFVNRRECTAAAIDRFWNMLRSQIAASSQAGAPNRFSGEAVSNGIKIPIVFGTRSYRTLRQAPLRYYSLLQFEATKCLGRSAASQGEGLDLHSSNEYKPLIEWYEKLEDPGFKGIADSCVAQVCEGSSDIPSLTEEETQLASAAKPFRDEFDQKVASDLSRAFNDGRATKAKLDDSLLAALTHSDGPVSESLKVRIGSFINDEIGSEYDCDKLQKINGEDVCIPSRNRFKTASPEWRSMMGQPSRLTEALNKQQDKAVIQSLSSFERGSAEFRRTSGATNWAKEINLKVSQVPPSPAEVKNVISRAAGFYLGILGSLEKSGDLPILDGRIVDRSFLQKIQKAANITLDELSQFLEAIQTLDYLKYLHTSPTARRARIELAEIVLQSPKLKSILMDLIRTKSDELRETKDVRNLGVGYGMCQDSYAFQLAEAPSPDQIGTAEQTANWAKAHVIEALQKRFPRECMAGIAKIVQETRFYFPPSQLEVQAKYSDVIRALRAGDEDALGNLCKLQEGRGRLVGDFAALATGEVQVSAQSVKYEEFGREVLSHELGHRVSGALRSGTLPASCEKIYKNARICLSKKHESEANVKIIPLKIGHSEIKVSDDGEEDWADLISGLASQGRPADTWCAAFKTKPLPMAYSPFSSPGDIHSGMMFRLLHLRNVQMGSLPAECQKMLSQANDNVDFSSCL